MASHPIYQFYAVLDDYKPKIWRRFQVSNDITIARFCYIIQVLFEMKASRPMMLEVPKGANFTAYFKKTYPDISVASNDTIWRYEIWDDYQPFNDLHKHVQVADATEHKLKHAVSEPGENMNFIYDFGDNWRISLTLEKVLVYRTLPAKEFPRALGGAGFGIVEGVGGVRGLTDLVKAFKTKKGADCKQFNEWPGVDGLDLSVFDLADMNFRLKKIPRIYKQCYEDRIMPTQQSINLIERKYQRKRR